MWPFMVAAASFVLAVASFSLPHQAHASSCALPLAAVESRIREIVPADSLEIERHHGAEVAAVVARLNAEPPVTGFVADAVLIAYWLGRPGAVVILGLGGCVSGQVTLPAARARALFGQTL